MVESYDPKITYLPDFVPPVEYVSPYAGIEWPWIKASERVRIGLAWEVSLPPMDPAAVAENPGLAWFAAREGLRGAAASAWHRWRHSLTGAHARRWVLRLEFDRERHVARCWISNSRTGAAPQPQLPKRPVRAEPWTPAPATLEADQVPAAPAADEPLEDF